MRLLTFLIFKSVLFATSIYSQTTIEPSSITLGIDQINMVDEDTIFHWGKTRSALRAGFFRAGNITNSNAGINSFAYGRENVASGDQSFAIGSFNEAKGGTSFALGSRNNVDGSGGFSLGVGNEVIGSQSFTIGNELISNSIFTIVLGHFNVDYADPVDDADRPLFVLGNGDRGDNIGRSNAITVLNDGRMSLRTTTPESDLHLVHQNGDHKGGFRIENEANGNWWRFYSRSAFNELELYNLTSGPQSAVGKFEASGNYVSLSDRRLKKKIIDLPYGLKDVLKLSPKRYQFKHIESHHDIGLIAQDVMNVIPELVNFDASKDRYMMNYDGFGVLSIKAIQELNEVVETQKETIGYQQNLIDDLIKRVEQLEKSN